jgi:hypothetical protein
LSDTGEQVEGKGYNSIYESEGVEQGGKSSLIELINHLRMYQKLTYQVIISIHNWES